MYSSGCAEKYATLLEITRSVVGEELPIARWKTEIAAEASRASKYFELCQKQDSVVIDEKKETFMLILQNQKKMLILRKLV